MGQFKERKTRWYDDGHDDWKVLWKFKTLREIEVDAYEWKWLVIRDDWHLGIIEQTEVSWMNNPAYWWSKFEFIDIWDIDDLKEYTNERFPGWFNLIDYLNEEFDEKFSDLDEDEMEDNHFTYQMWLDEVHICSKKDGHIKWLYDKWYIDKEKIPPLVTKAFAYVQWEGNFWSLLDDLYAYLAVCDEPLKELASVLK